MLNRSAKVSFEILSGKEIILEGQETAKHLWNHMRWCMFGYNEQLRKIRGDDWDRFKRNLPQVRGVKYLGKFGIQKEMKDYWAAINLSDRCFSYIVQEFDVSMKSWFSNLKSNPKARPPRYTKQAKQLTFEVGRNAKPIGEWQYRLTVLGGSILERHAVVKLRLAPGIKMKQVKLIRINPDLKGTIVYKIEQKETTGTRLAGIDLGIINLAAVGFDNGESILYSGKGLLSEDRLNEKRAKKCKPKNWSKGRALFYPSERNKNYRKKSGNTRNLAIHNMTTDIIRECLDRGVGTIVLGNLTGIRNNKNLGKQTNQKFHSWAFAKIKEQLEYKAEEYSIEIKLVSEAYTSQTCHVCGVIQKSNRKTRGNYICEDCGIEINADINGAFNILNKVSPAPAYAGVGVGGNFPAPPSTDNSQGIGKELSQISPTFVAKFNLQDFSIVQAQCSREKTTIAIGDL